MRPSSAGLSWRWVVWRWGKGEEVSNDGRVHAASGAAGGKLKGAQAAHTGNPPPPPPSPLLWQVHGNTEEGGLVLDDLPKGSLLEACLVLGRLQEPTYELAKPARGDRWLKVSVCSGGAGGGGGGPSR